MIFPLKPSSSGISIPFRYREDSPNWILTMMFDPNPRWYPSEDFVDIKLDARNLIEADVKSALTDLDWFGKVRKFCAKRDDERFA